MLPASESPTTALALALYKMLALEFYRLLFWTPAELALVLVVGLMLGLAAAPIEVRGHALRSPAGLVALGPAAFGRILLLFLPSAYLASDMPPFRAQLFTRLVSLVTVAGVAIFAGRALRGLGWPRPNGWVGAALLAALALAIPLVTAPEYSRVAAAAEAYAIGWDQMAVEACRRDLHRRSELRPAAPGRSISWRARAQGERRVLVPDLGSYLSTSEIRADPSYWVNECAARYFGVDEVVAAP